MTREEINTRNIAIVTYAGLGSSQRKSRYTGKLETFYRIDETLTSDVVSMVYHCNWDWLMPVVIKINTIQGNPFEAPDIRVFIGHNSCHIVQYHKGAVVKTLAERSGYTPDKLIECVYLVVSDFCLDWVEQQKSVNV